VLAATLEVLEERGFDGVDLPLIARRAGVHPTSLYRRWGTRSRLVGEALLERAASLSPTPDTGSLRSDLQQLLLEGAALVGTGPVRALFEVLLASSGNPAPDLARARDRFWAAHVEEARTVVERAVDRAELPHGTDPAALVELVIGPALLRLLLLGQPLGPREAGDIVGRAVAALGGPGGEGE
jgi:AcrR family transcriptional regulator